MPKVKDYTASEGDYDSKLGFAIANDCPCRPCFHHHDFGHLDWQGHMVHDFKCQTNANHGCPDPPLPEPIHDFGVKRTYCKKCKVSRGYKYES